MKKCLVNNENKYWEFIRKITNSSKVKTGFIEQDHIDPREHTRFMQKYGHLYYICLLDEIPVGFVGSIDGDIRVATDPKYQGMGIGKYMISEIMCKYPGSYAKIKIDNEASLALFKSCGFTEKYLILERE